MATIGLSIIVKNEAAVIARCLRSVQPICDYFLVVDTGSSDGTQEIVRRYLSDQGLAGQVVDMPWRDFAFNRTAALAEMRKRSDIDYCLMIDADEQLFYDDGFDPEAFKASLQADWLSIRTAFGAVEYLRPQLVRNALDFLYRGVLHEFLVVPDGAAKTAIAEGIVNRPTADGARSQNPQKYLDDAVALGEALETETDPFLRTRYQFYLAQSLRDAGRPEDAIAAYNLRATMGGWREEVFVSYYEIGKLGERLDYPQDEIIVAHLRAHEASPGRAESLVAAARYARGKERYALAYLLARRGLELTPPGDALFVERTAFEYRAKDEAAVAAYWLGHYEDCLRWCEELLSSGLLPRAEIERVTRNRAFAAEKLGRGET